MIAGAVLVVGMFAAQVASAADAAPTKRTDMEPQNGVPFRFRDGWFVESQLGMFTTIGGAKSFSNAQPYVGISVGHDFKLTASPWLTHLDVFLSAAHGPNAGSCRMVDVNDSTGEANGCAFAVEQGGRNALENFSVIPIEVGGRLGLKEVLPRFYPYAVLTFGYSILTPQIFDQAAGGSLHFGAGIGAQYGTRLDGLAVGLEVLFRSSFSPNIMSLSIFPRVAYVF